jgi:predicted enzyme related to lactoylglutathione lyase
MNEHEKINYVELPAKDLQSTKIFFTKVFDWSFADYGPEYIAFSKEGLDGGFYKSDLSSSKIIDADGSIIKPIFEFPGGHRFHFSDPNGNEFAVWSDKGV